MRGHGQEGLGEIFANGNTYLKGEMTSYKFTGGLCRLTGADGTVIIAPRTGEEFNGIGMIKYNDGGTYCGEIYGSHAPKGKGWYMSPNG